MTRTSLCSCCALAGAVPHRVGRPSGSHRPRRALDVPAPQIDLTWAGRQQRQAGAARRHERRLHGRGQADARRGRPRVRAHRPRRQHDVVVSREVERQRRLALVRSGQRHHGTGRPVRCAACRPTSLEITWTANPANANVDGYTVRYATSADFAAGTVYDWAGPARPRAYVADGLVAGAHVPRRGQGGGQPGLGVHRLGERHAAAGAGAHLDRCSSARTRGCRSGSGSRRSGATWSCCCAARPTSPAGPACPRRSRRAACRSCATAASRVDKDWDDGVSPDQYLTMVDNLRANGIEPILQVPYHDGAFSPTRRRRPGGHVNGAPNSRAVKYWSVGNEPNDVYESDAQRHRGLHPAVRARHARRRSGHRRRGTRPQLARPRHHGGS